MRNRRFIAFGDVHFPQQDDAALEVLKKVVRDMKPDLVLCLGDLLDCKAFSTHSPDITGDTPYQSELEQAGRLFDELQKSCGRLVMLEGNHEYRVTRYAARERAGKAALSMLSPRANLSRGRKNFTYVSYEGTPGQYAHYAVAPWLMAVHGWSCAADATRRHLWMGQGRSVIHAHTHRSDHHIAQNYWGKGTVEAVSAGCLCRLVPTYNVGSPVTWTHGFVQGFVGRSNHTLYFVPVVGGSCVLPSGKEVKV